ncbi:MAG: hypothetical protein LBR23_01970 [Spirochaetaceae bacterium]|nr:hypothetical protein [Spirochaetaceae bacterium]
MKKVSLILGAAVLLLAAMLTMGCEQPTDGKDGSSPSDVELDARVAAAVTAYMLGGTLSGTTITVNNNATIANGTTAKVPAGYTLVVPADKTLTNSGTIDLAGQGASLTLNTAAPIGGTLKIFGEDASNITAAQGATARDIKTINVLGASKTASGPVFEYSRDGSTWNIVGHLASSTSATRDGGGEVTISTDAWVLVDKDDTMWFATRSTTGQQVNGVNGAGHTLQALFTKTSDPTVDYNSAYYILQATGKPNWTHTN